MYIIQAFVTVKPGCEDDFIAASTANHLASMAEPGVLRFDVFQQLDDPTRFTLVEVYRSEEDLAEHKKTDHYFAWAEAVGPLQAEPRTKAIYRNVAPGEDGWS